MIITYVIVSSSNGITSADPGTSLRKIALPLFTTYAKGISRGATFHAGLENCRQAR